MTATDDTGSPLERLETAASSAAVDVFRLLNGETRLAILLALWEAQDPTDPDAGVPFSTLRSAVGMRDSGQFNYHLGKLKGVLVESTPVGYRLTPGGLSLVRSVVAGTGSDTTLAPTGIGVACHNCGSGTQIAYEDGWLYHLCPECDASLGVPGHADADRGAVLFQEPLPPSILEHRSPEEVYAAGVFRLVTAFRMKAGGLCPECSAPTHLSLAVCDAHDTSDGSCTECGRQAPAYAEWDCSVCRFHGMTEPTTVAVLSAPAVAFYHERGTDLIADAADFEAATHTLRTVREATTAVLATDPPRFLVSTTHGDETLRLTLDEHLRVVDEAVVPAG